MTNYFPESRTMSGQHFAGTNGYQGTQLNFYTQQGDQLAGYFPSNQQLSNPQSPLIDPQLSQEQPMERFLSGNDKHYLGTHLQGARENASYLLSPSTVRHNSPFRHDSPFSQHFSGTSSGALSPPAESDRFHEGTQGPPTPPDNTTPFIAQAPYEQVDSTGPNYSLTGLTENCVSMAQINPSEAAMVPTDQTSMLAMASGSLPNHAGSAHVPSEASFFQQPFMSQNTFENMPPQYPYGQQQMSLPTTPSFSGFESPAPQPSPMSAPLQRPSPSPSAPHLKPPPRETSSRHARRPSATSNRRKFKHASPSSPSRARPVSGSNATGSRNCEHCAKGGFTDVTLQKHIRTQHTRPFVCYFEYAGCNSTFATKNEWKRHVVSQHLALHYWICTDGECARATGPSTHKRPFSLPTHGCIFNRKDLYTQHVRRMHAPAEAKAALKAKKTNATPEWDEKLRAMQQAAEQVRCELPTYMACPVDDCFIEFKGKTAWDDRMEHVARHLETASAGEGPPVIFGRDTDPTLTQWAESPEVAVVQRTPNGWELSNPIKGDNGHRRTSCELSNEDAEGEEQ